jgi:hypothetical protein
MLKTSIWLSAAVVLVVAAACSGSSGGGAVKGAAGSSGEGGAGGDAAVTASVSNYCSQACAAERDCDKSLDVKSCYSDCKAYLAAPGPNLRPDFLVSITACVQSKDCKSLLAHTALQECRDEAVAQLTPSKEGTSFCSDLADAAQKCNNEFSKAECVNLITTFTDEAIQAAEECLGQSCSKMASCVRATLGIIDSGDNGAGGNGAGGETSMGGQPSGGGTTSFGGKPSFGGHPGIGLGAAGEAGAGGAADTTPFTGSCDDNSPSKCVSATQLNTCFSGEYAVLPCKSVLSSFGLTGTACDAGCQPTGFLDLTCQAGVSNLCQCEGPCTDDDILNYYIGCYTDDPAGYKKAIQCMANAASCDDVSACVAAAPPM